MEKYFTRLTPSSSTSSKRKTPSDSASTDDIGNSIPIYQYTPLNVVDVDNLPSDPSERPRILSYNVNQRDKIRRHYWIKGPNQPRGHEFPQTKFGPNLRRFVPEWFVSMAPRRGQI